METILFDSANTASFDRDETDYDPVAEQVDNGVDVMDTASALFMRETGIGSLIRYGAAYVNAQDGPERTLTGDGPAFNPYVYAQDREEQLADLTPFLRRGSFEDVSSPMQFEMRAALLRQELKDLHAIQNGSGAGLGLGMAFSLLDVANVIPVFGISSKVGMAANALRVGAGTTAIVGGQELALHSLQETRTAKESFLNIGLGGFLGAGIGYLGRSITPDSLIHPDHPNNPLKVENARKDGAGIITPGMATSEADTVGDLSAAATRAVPSESTEKLGGTSPLGRVFQRVTPVGRLFMRKSAVARTLGLRIADKGGVLTKGEAEGGALLSAEDIALNYQILSETLIDNQRLQLIQLNAELGGSKGQFGQALKTDVARASAFMGREMQVKQVNPHEFNEVIYKRLNNHWDDAEDLGELTTLMKTKGIENPDEAAKKILARADGLVKEIHKSNKTMEDAMVKWGLIDEADRKGANYGMAQMWSPNRLIQDREAAREFFTEMFGKRPDEDWLEETYGMTLKQFEELDDEAILAARATAEEGAAVAPTKSEIITDWAGDDATFAMSRAHVRLDAAERAVKEAEEVEGYIRHGLNVARREKDEATLKSTKLSAARSEAEIIERGNIMSQLLNDFNVKFNQVARTTSDVSRTVKKGPDAFESIEHYREAAELRRKLIENSRDMDRLQKRRTKLTVALADAEKARVKLQAEVDEIRAGLKLQGKDVRAVRKELKAAQRASKAAGKRTNLETRVDQLLDNLTDRSANPYSILDHDFVAGTGRAKRRSIRMTKEEARQAATAGWLNTNPFQVIDQTYRDLGGRMALREMFEDFGDTEDLTNALKSVAEDYDELIKKAKTPKERRKLLAEREDAMNDMRGLRDRMLGRNRFPTDPTSLITWGSGRLREWNFLRFGGGFLVSSLTDIANTVLTAGFGALTLRNGRAYRRITREALRTGKQHEMLAILRAAEITFAHSRTAMLMQVDHMAEAAGVGVPGSMKHGITSSISRVMGGMSEKMNLVNGMAHWNTALKVMAGMAQMQNIRRMVDSYDTLSKLDVAKLGAIGIDANSAKSLKHYFNLLGKDIDGVFEPRVDLWTDAGGRQARRTLEIALKRTTNRAVMTPGIGDTPLFMSTEAGRMILQFATFGFTAMNKHLTPMTQRITQYQDMEALSVAAMGLATGSLITAIKTEMRGEDAEDLTAAQWVSESIDRSGLIGYLGPYADGVIKQVGSPLNDLMGAEVFAPSSRYQRNNWVQSFMGPWANTLTSAGQGASSVIQGDFDDVRQKALLLAPYSTFFRLGAVIGDKASGD